MRKAIVFVIVIVIIAAGVVGGLFWWRSNMVVVGSVADYVINGQIITNEKAELSFEVPAGWEVEKIDEMEGSVIVYSPKTEFIEARTVPLKKGCLVGVATIYEKINFEKLKEKINDIHFGLGIKSDKFEIITINNQQALKNTYNTIDTGQGKAVYIPHKNRFYNFTVYAGPEDEEQCLKNFDEFLNKISYK